MSDKVTIGKEKLQIWKELETEWAAYHNYVTVPNYMNEQPLF